MATRRRKRSQREGSTLESVRRAVASGDAPEHFLRAIEDGLLDLEEELEGSKDSYDRECLTNTRKVLRYLTDVTDRLERWMHGDLRDL